MKESKKMYVTCPRCEETWQINANKWRNTYSIFKTGKKVIHCPFCNKRLTLDAKTTLRALEGKLDGWKKNRNICK